MNTVELECLIQCALSRVHAQVCFLGVFAKDTIPHLSETLHYPVCFVVNSDPSNLPGTHWLAFYFISSSTCEFFDSYGLPPSFYHFNFLAHSNISCEYNKLVLQAFDSQVCGHYCAFFTIQRNSKSLDCIIQTLYKRPNRDKYVFSVIQPLMPPKFVIQAHKSGACFSQCCKSRSTCTAIAR